MKVLEFFIVLVLSAIFFQSSYCQELGDNCIFKKAGEEVQGKCKYTQDCKSVDFTKNTTLLGNGNICHWQNRVIIVVCCPILDKSIGQTTEKIETTKSSSEERTAPRLLDIRENSSTFCVEYNQYYLELPEEVIVKKSHDERIIGGRKSVRNFPYLGTIAYYDELNHSYEFRCGGALISSRHVLTAARESIRMIMFYLISKSDHCCTLQIVFLPRDHLRLYHLFDLDMNIMKLATLTREGLTIIQ